MSHEYIRKVLNQVHPDLQIRQEVKEALHEFVFMMLRAMVCAQKKNSMVSEKNSLFEIRYAPGQTENHSHDGRCDFSRGIYKIPHD